MSNWNQILQLLCLRSFERRPINCEKIHGLSVVSLLLQLTTLWEHSRPQTHTKVTEHHISLNLWKGGQCKLKPQESETVTSFIIRRAPGYKVQLDYVAHHLLVQCKYLLWQTDISMHNSLSVTVCFCCINRVSSVLFGVCVCAFLLFYDTLALVSDTIVIHSFVSFKKLNGAFRFCLRFYFSLVFNVCTLCVWGKYLIIYQNSYIHTTYHISYLKSKIRVTILIQLPLK